MADELAAQATPPLETLEAHLALLGLGLPLPLPLLLPLPLPLSQAWPPRWARRTWTALLTRRSG